MLPRKITALLLLALTTASLSAQNPPAQKPVNPDQLPGLPSPKENDIMCRCVSTFLPGKNETFFFKIDDTYHEVSLTGEGMSLPFPVRGSTTFTLYKKTPAGEDAPPYTPVVEQALSGDGKDFLVFLSRKNDKAPMKSKSVNLNTSSYPANNIYLFNESPAALGLQVNTSKAVVKPFESFNYKFQNTDRDTYTSAKIVMRYKGENKVMASKRLRLVPGRRIILVAFPSKARTQLGATPLRLIITQDQP
ncbi:hypothetical protein NT6N_28380 [Oceaniferula spumae]|uniref:DUF4397 domain-containing protein n=1 Tax=Oceaniferula spumae TaxID=2979115 RepID=A0AAT9FPC8_9BACT